MKGVSIPINTLVFLAVAIIVLLAAVAWFMGAFGSSAEQSNLRQRFHSSCLSWSATNCDKARTTADPRWGFTPDIVCVRYVQMKSGTCVDINDCTDAGTYCNSPAQGDYETIAAACGCVKPYGMD